MSTFTRSRLLVCTAQCSGVEVSAPWAFTSAFFAIKDRTAAASDFFTASTKGGSRAAAYMPTAPRVNNEIELQVLDGVTFVVIGAPCFLACNISYWPCECAEYG